MDFPSETGRQPHYVVFTLSHLPPEKCTDSGNRGGWMERQETLTHARLSEVFSLAHAFIAQDTAGRHGANVIRVRLP